MLDIAALSELEAQAFATLAITSATHVHVTNTMGFDLCVYVCILALFLLLSHSCRLARIWLSMAVTQASLSSTLWASKCHVWPVLDTIRKSKLSSSDNRTQIIHMLVLETGKT